MISYFMLMHIGSSEVITLVIAPEGEEQTLEDLPECWITGQPLSLKASPEYSKSPMFYKISLESFMFDALGDKS